MDRATFLLCAGLLAGAALLGCPGQPPAPPVTTTTTLAPTPEPNPLCPSNVAPEEGPEGEYVPHSDQLIPIHLEQLIAFRDAVGGCDKAHPYAKLADTALRLRDYGLCTIAKGEDLLIWREANIFEAYYAVTIPTGCFATRDRMYKGTLAWVSK